MLTPFLTGLVLGNCMARLWLAAGARFVSPIVGAWDPRSPVVKHPRL